MPGFYNNTPLGVLRTKDTVKDKRTEFSRAQILYAPIFDGRLPRPVGTGDWFTKAREMRRDPTIAFARDLAAAPLLASEWSVEADSDPEMNDEDAEILDVAQEFIGRQFDRLKTNLLRHAVNGMVDYGWQGFERVYEIVSDEKLGEKLVGVRKLKPLLQDFTEIVIDDYGNFDGLFNNPIVLAIGESSGGTGTASQIGEVQLDRSKCLILSRGVEGTDWYGSPLLQRTEYAYDRWKEADGAAERYYNKLAGAHWVVHYPIGTSVVDGEDTDNFVIAQRILDQVRSSGMMIIPRQILSFVDDMNASMNSVEDAWNIELISAGGAQGADFTERQKHLEALMVRGMNLPERSVLEGQFGTKAEAEAHADFAIELSEMWHREIVNEINAQVVDDLVEINWSKRFRGRVRLVTSPLSDSRRAMIQRIYEQLIGTPDGMLEEIDRVDWATVREKLGIPTKPLSEHEEEEIEEQAKQRREQAAAQGAPGGGGAEGGAPGLTGPGGAPPGLPAPEEEGEEDESDVPSLDEVGGLVSFAAGPFDESKVKRDGGKFAKKEGSSAEKSKPGEKTWKAMLKGDVAQMNKSIKSLNNIAERRPESRETAEKLKSIVQQVRKRAQSGRGGASKQEAKVAGRLLNELNSQRPKKEKKTAASEQIKHPKVQAAMDKLGLNPKTFKDSLAKKGIAVAKFVVDKATKAIGVVLNKIGDIEVGGEKIRDSVTTTLDAAKQVLDGSLKPAKLFEKRASHSLGIFHADPSMPDWILSQRLVDAGYSIRETDESYVILSTPLGDSVAFSEDDLQRLEKRYERNGRTYV